ncbi:MAG: chromosome segregation protein SMC [Actinomycetales bacterium]|nr:MAG: chromosome segregation protein SMC [Actinomycetales bacterium]
MYVKSMTLKGFKSFASATTLRLEPGITCIVGPNGSGKSNVVDALAWVMGEQGAKSLRGGKMEDVIFAGTAGRPPLGRAEVSLTIDNTDGALPIDYTEVTISRTMFRSGGSDYAINGTTCRLLDIQELLSDSGIGREMHVIVGQGQLDSVLRATPEERRGFIEEAAGVLKHRKRKERALRKLDAMEANLNRVQDLTTEIRRQLGPLGRQAETARRAGIIQAEVRDARLRLIADDLVQLTATLEQEVADETALIARRTEVEAELAVLGGRLQSLESEVEAARPELAAAQERWFALRRLVERLSATATLAGERVRLLADDEAADADNVALGRDPEALRAQAVEQREQHTALIADIQVVAAQVADAVAARSEAESRYAAEQARIAGLVRAAADRREGLARLAGEVAARQSKIDAGEAEIGRLREVVAESQARANAAERRFAELEAEVAAGEAGEEGLDAAYEQAAADLAALEAEAGTLREQELAAEHDRRAGMARIEALELSLARKDGAAALIDVQARGLVGSVAQLVNVEPGHETAIAAALGWAADALVFDSADRAAQAIETLRAADSGRAGLLVAETAREVDPPQGQLPSGARRARDVVSCSDDLRPVVEQLLDQVLLVTDNTQAQEAVAAGRIGVTPDGDVFAPGFVLGGSDAGPSVLELNRALDSAREQVANATRSGEAATFTLAGLRDRIGQARDTVDAALERLHESDARMAGVGEQLGALGSAARSARTEAQRTEAAIAAALPALDADRAAYAELAERLARASETDTEDTEPDLSLRDGLEAAAAAARAHETETRLALRTGEERARAIRDRADALDAAADAELAARERQAARRARRIREVTVATAVRQAAAYAAERIRDSAELADTARKEGERARTVRDEQLVLVRREMSLRQDELRELTDSVHRDEVARTQQRLRIEALQHRAMEEYGIDEQTLVEEFGPHLPVPVLLAPGQSGTDQAPDPPGQPFVREVQEKRLRAAERKLSSLGRINPLALEEYAALEERHAFLTTQLEDLKASKRDLLDIVREIDDRVEQAFASAFADTAEQFGQVFARLFPGGEGRLTLTDPGDLLTTGLEVEARPPGKKIKRLSLLSGGERSLVAVALLVAIFKARPSPFYIMDEVEAALDDANLGRLLTLFAELRDSSQLIVITHQKKTMEIADALYGVSMRGDGVTALVSQRLRDVAAVAAG